MNTNMTATLTTYLANSMFNQVMLAEDLTAKSLTVAGWGVMLFSICTVICLLSYCLSKVLALPPVEFEEHVKGPLEIDTHDQSDAN